MNIKRFVYSFIAAIGAIATFGLIYYCTRILAAIIERNYVLPYAVGNPGILSLKMATETSDLTATALLFTMLAVLLPIFILFGLIGTLIAGGITDIRRDLSNLKLQLDAEATRLQSSIDQLNHGSKDSEV
jgi:hypothetical protein